MTLKIPLGKDDGRVNYGYTWTPDWWNRSRIHLNEIPKGIGGEHDTSRGTRTTGFRPTGSIR
jgi:hypothetical protein